MLRTALAATGLALAGGLGVLTVNATERAGAQSEFHVTAEQLRINQRISQAGVRRSNEALGRLDALAVPPLTATFYAFVTGPPSAGGGGGGGGSASAPPPPVDLGPRLQNVGVESITPGPSGSARVTFTGVTRYCTWSAVAADASPGSVAVTPDAENERALLVWTWDAAGAPAARSVRLTLFCTGSSHGAPATS